MGIAALAFYFFAVVAIISAVFVTLSRHPVHSVLWLILAFISSAGLFVLLVPVLFSLIFWMKLKSVASHSVFGLLNKDQ